MLEQLIRSTTYNTSDTYINQQKRIALSTLANSQSARVSQYEVSSRLQGLIEKSRILNNDPLAEALELRLAELSTRSDRWTPEILTLLLDLSDRPTRNSNAQNLVSFQPDLPSALTWSEIVADDPLEDLSDIWQNVDFAADTSDEDEPSESIHRTTSEFEPESGVLEKGPFDARTTLIEQAGMTEFRKIERAQFWRDPTRRHYDMTCLNFHEKQLVTILTEGQAVREVIFMLLGLPTSIFTNANDGKLAVSAAFTLQHVSQESMGALLKDFAQFGDMLLSIRQWVGKKTLVPLEQTFQATLASHLTVVDRTLSTFQSRILMPHAHISPSLLELHVEVYHTCRLIQQIHEILQVLMLEDDVDLPFRILECLFDRTCINQGIGDENGYEYVGEIFFACLQTYLKPIRLWMEKGHLNERDRVMFIARNKEDVELNVLWQDQHHLVYSSAGILRAPKFLHLAAQKLFNTGKSVDFLNRLGHEHVSDHCIEDMTALTFNSVCQPSEFGLLSPFVELFDTALEKWVASKHHSSSSMLRTQLEVRCGLRNCLDALEYIYFFRNGALSGNVNVKVFERIDKGNRHWNDAFIVTEMFRSAFSVIPCIESDRLGVDVRSAPYDQSLYRAQRSMSVLECLRVTYTLPWAVANVIKIEAMDTYQRILIFLAQLQRAKYLLHRQRVPRTWSASREHSPQIYTLHHRLLWFTNTVLTYITEMVISVATADMRSAMKLAEDVDSMVLVHQAYVIQLEEQCLLLRKHAPIQQAITSVLDLAVLFSDIQASYTACPSPTVLNSGSTKSDRGHEHAGYTRQGKVAGLEGYSDDDDDNSDNDRSNADSSSNHDAVPPNGSRLGYVLDTFHKLHGFVTTAVRGISKADSAACWKMLDNSLTAGLERD